MRQKANDPKWLGQKFGRLTVVGFEYRKKRHKWCWVCQCDCGGKVIQQAWNIREGHTKSCGCYQREVAGKTLITHGQTYSRLYRIYNAMKNRCYNKKQPNYAIYGGRGITICQEWLDNFSAFYDWAMANGYQDNLSIDRIDNNGSYSPENCRWSTRTEQQRNTSRNNIITHDGKTQILTDWCKELGLNFHTVEYRIHQKGMSALQALGLEEKEHE